MWGNDQNEMIFFYFQPEDLYLTMLILCRKNLNWSDRMDCKIITIEGEEKALVVGSPDHCQCFEIQKKLGG
jgi:hypothetical protein